ncbi:hypothetical protein PCASD_01842 [Puccinia coronata f. sp. avenae]|uniref:Glycosylphosphatidylinositol anchor biosynthesis protein 11 n=1 Tax=Puccinia coronata f. sp. avenae TaxID=200324 RepID=A0A2N5VJK9_9BASI|nr:hypothetical protein PCASD_01842 [Puccinia coronata f. sp. avenae]
MDSTAISKYYSVVPIHLLLIHATVYYGTLSRGTPVLLGTTAGTLLIQLWFTDYLRRWSNNNNNNNNKPANDTKLGQLRTRLRVVIAACPLAQLPSAIAHELRSHPPLAAWTNRLYLWTKETVFINTTLALATTLVMVLLGAPITPISQLARTTQLATFLTLLSFAPASVLLGWNQGRQKENWIRIFSRAECKSHVEVALLFPAAGACFGAWLGAIPIPLDWDRPWQAWPITCVVGASLGHAVGSFASILHSLSSRVTSSSSSS